MWKYREVRHKTAVSASTSMTGKGKVKALDLIEKDDTGRFLNLFTNMGQVDGAVDFEVASEFVCRMYGQSKEQDVDKARYTKLMQMSGKIDKENPLANIKKVDCALLPPSRQTLKKKMMRAHYVTVLWSHANTASPDQGLSPTDYGWCCKEGLLQPTWFDGPSVLDSL
ncbi:uncharacterized protein LOC125741923 isoform X1 [Brienomyrus brachyistius]|uniref:uncharacterized protein LOC125741923 isoform X1 n=1 Tax=Brienomyrus brachyistius TaxID=42636 RepID=UPI0020B41F62|nr:uncharacterized protein LOC125741923 isoform X1 [Brienomyrus brachyistius]